MVRTVNEAPCMVCGRITNHYDALMGRLCPACAKSQIDIMIQNRCRMDGVPYIPEKEKKPTEPLIDHSADIDAHLRDKE